MANGVRMKVLTLLFTSCSLQSGCYGDVQAESITQGGVTVKPYTGNIVQKLQFLAREKKNPTPF